MNGVWDAHRFEHLCGQPAAGVVRQASALRKSTPRPVPASVTARAQLGRGGRSFTAAPLAPRFQRLTSAGPHRCTGP